MAAGYTHRHWRDNMNDINQALGLVLVPALDHMRNDLVRVRAGNEQLTQSGRFITMVRDLATDGERIYGDHHPRLRRVGEAQAAAGGVAEVAGDKEYNQRR